MQQGHLGVGRRASELVLALLVDRVALPAGLASLVPVVLTDAHDCSLSLSGRGASNLNGRRLGQRHSIPETGSLRVSPQDKTDRNIAEVRLFRI